MIAQESRRPEEPLTMLAAAAAGQALREAGIESDGERRYDVGLEMSTVLGPSGAVESYLEALQARGPRSARPAHFVDTLLSMPASRLGITFGLRSSIAVLGGSSAFELASDWLRSGRERTVPAGAGEYLPPKCARYPGFRQNAPASTEHRSGRAPLFAVLESALSSAQRGSKVLGQILGAGGASEP